MYKKYVKRPMDAVLSVMALIMLAPVFLILAVWIKLDSKGPVLFKQDRVGMNKEIFSILKFRTMRTDAPHDMPTHLLKDPEAYIKACAAYEDPQTVPSHLVPATQMGTIRWFCRAGWLSRPA